MEVQRATHDMFDKVHDVLLEFTGDTLSKSQWAELFFYRWPTSEDYRGWVMVDNSKVVGFLGAVFSVREVAGETAKFCKLTSWVVRPPYRGRSLSLLAPLAGLSEYTLCNFSPTTVACAAFKRFGFTELEDRVVLIPPIVPGLGARGFRLLADDDEIASVLSGEDLRLFRDHRDYRCRHLVLSDGHAYCYAICSKTHFRRYSASYVHHLTNPGLFVRVINQVQRALAVAHHTALTVIDERLLDGHRVPLAWRHRLRQPRLYKPSSKRPVARAAIDTAYSECVLLDSERWTFNY